LGLYGKIRIHLANLMNIVPEDELKFVWVMDFPMFEIEDGRTKALHHPFTMPKLNSEGKLEFDDIEAY